MTKASYRRVRAIDCNGAANLAGGRQWENPPGRITLLPKGTDFAARKARNEGDALRLVPDDRYSEFIEERIDDESLRSVADDCLRTKDWETLNEMLFPSMPDPPVAT